MIHWFFICILANMNKYKKDSKKLYKCKREHCEKWFSLQTNNIRHQKSCDKGEIIEPELQEIKCNNEWCQKKFPTKFNLDRHSKTCKKKVIKSYDCQQCNAKFTKPSQLKKHGKAHEIKPMFMCDKCSNVYVRKDKFQQHLTNCIDRSTSNQQISMASLILVMIEIGEGSDFGHAGQGGSDYLLDLAWTYGLPEELYVNEDTNITHEDNNEENRSEDITIAINDHEHAPQVTIAEELYVNEDINDNHEDEIEEKRMNIAINDRGHVPPVIILDEEIESSSEQICSARNGENVLQYKVELADCTRYMLKQLKHQAKHSAVKRQEFLKWYRPIREMFDKFKKEHPECTYSMSLYWHCKPFYVVPPSDREMEGCLCKKCLNPHALYGVLKKHIKTLPLSLSEYLTMEFECRNDKVVNFPKVECIKGLWKMNAV